MTMCCRSNKTVMKNNEIPIQRDLGDWIDIDYQKPKNNMHSSPYERNGPDSSGTSDSDDCESANAPIDTMASHAKQGSLTFGGAVPTNNATFK